MRPRRSSVACRIVATVVLLAAGGRIGEAQTGTLTQGALELLLPTGARALGVGQAAVAGLRGSDGLWWNPALIARAPREAALHYAQSIATDVDLTGVVVYPVQYVGAFAVTV